MEAKEYGNVGKKAIWFVKSLLCGYIVTGFLLLILALMLYKLGLSEQNVNAGIVLIYVISTFSAGFVLGKLAGKRKFLWGLFAGIPIVHVPYSEVLYTWPSFDAFAGLTM